MAFDARFQGLLATSSVLRRLIPAMLISTLLFFAPARAVGKCDPASQDQRGPLDGFAGHMDGQSHWAQVNSGVYFAGGPFTVEAWVKPDYRYSWERILDFSNGAPSDNIILSAST